MSNLPLCAVVPVAMSNPWIGRKMNAFFQWNSHGRSIMMASKRSTGLPARRDTVSSGALQGVSN